MSGRLFIIATPIGNLKDLTIRARDALGEADLVLAEDTRVTIKLLNHLGLRKRMVSCYDFNESQRLVLLEEIGRSGGSIALVSDAGTPLVSDPGFQIVRKAIELGMKVIPIPGPSAAVLALISSGLACERFLFEGFPPKKQGDRLKCLAALRRQERTIIFYIAPHDLTKFLASVEDILGDRQACLAREMTKIHEEFIRGSISSIRQVVSEREVLGECVLVIAGAAASDSTPGSGPEKDQIVRELNELIDTGMHLKEASNLIAKQYGLSKSAVYKLGIEVKRESTG